MRKSSLIAASAALTVCALAIGPAAFAADSWPPSGDKAVGRAQPQFSGYRAQDIRDWSPETDPWAADMRAEVPLQPRIGLDPSVQVNPTMDGKAQIMLMQADYGNGFIDQTPYNNDYAENTFNFWQYADYWSPWHGQATATVPSALYDPATSDYRSRLFEFGTVNIPNPAYTNAAHRNGVKSIGEIFFAKQNRPGQVPDEFFEKDAKGDYVVADKLIEMAHYYGFDGWFINDEFTNSGQGGDPRFRDFGAYLTAHGMWTQFYDNDNSVIDATTKSWVEQDDGTPAFTANFTNYDWPNYIDKSLSNAKSLGIDPYTQTFLGVEANQTKFSGSHVSGAQVEKDYAPRTHNPRTSIALFTPSDYYQRGLDDDLKTPSTESPKMQDPAYQWMVEDRERMYFSGVKSDVTQTGKQPGYSRPDVAVSDASGWAGVADFTPSRSVIGGDSFYSSFNTGHGTQYWTDGDLVSTSEWSNINDQSILPSWQWWIDAQSGTKMNADFDYGPTTPRKDVNGNDIAAPYKEIGGYTGGSSLVLYGNDLSGKNTMHLFATDLAVANDSQATITYANGNANGATLKLGVVLSDDPSTVHELDLPAGTTSGAWTTSTVDLSQFAGKDIASIDLIVDGTASSYQINVGNIQVTTTKAKAPAAPTGLTIDQVYGTGEAQLHWNTADFSTVDNYRLYARTPDGTRHFLGALYGDNLYVKNLPQASSLTFELVAVGKDGQESKPETVTYSYNELPKNLTVAESTNSNIAFQEASAQGTLDVSWQAPDGKTPQNYLVTAKLLDTPSDAPQNVTYSMVVPGSSTSASLPMPVLDGYKYVLTVAPANGSGKALATGISFTGSTHDSLAKAMDPADVTISNGKYTLRNPVSNDWYTLTVLWNGEKQYTATRGHITTTGDPASGADPNQTLTETKTLPGTDGTLTIELTDYAGNKAAPLNIEVKGGEAVPVAPQQAAVTLDGDSTVDAGAKVPVSVSGFTPGTEVVVRLGASGNGSLTAQDASVTPNASQFQIVAADGTGTAHTTVTAPDKKGDYTVTATQSYRTKNTQASVALTVKAQPAPPSPSPTPTGPVAPTTPSASGGTLPATGANTLPWLAAGIGGVGIGVLLVLRRRLQQR